MSDLNREPPLVTLCLATSLDGKISAKAGTAPNFTSRADLEKLFGLRAEADALLIGANTVRQEQLPPLVRQEQRVAERLRLGKPEHPAAVIVSGSLDLPWESAYFREKKQRIFILTASPKPEQSAIMKRLGLECLDTGGEINLGLGLEMLGQRGYRKILAEGGGKLTHSLLAAGVVDRLFLTLAPLFIAGRQTPNLCHGELLDPLPRFDLVACHRVESELHLEYGARKKARDTAETLPAS